ncbi:hypothetical protein [Ensifer sp. SL37]|uniref:hypothetical protein n=1 Tax=Ensifer sp. SL37 TaxID=2995137 RepID=UPI002276E19B|nr:hypothetical protein [Ensifer sp. SL37]MCY1740378.1 hypothetical protein [Ensifer sp. SL37]
MLFEEESAGGHWLLAFEVLRVNLAEQRDESWTFSMLTRGDRQEDVRAFCQSIRREDKHSQIVVVGPRTPLLDSYDVQFLDRDYGQYAAIAKKKNDVVEVATGQNILFAHDRYILNRGFLSGFSTYGYDFEYVTTKQFYSSGKHYPALCAIDDLRELILGRVYDTQNDKEFWQTPYLNGGFFAVKKHVIEKHPLNPMLFHHQAEDVEFARHVASVGILPLLNPYSSAVTNAPETSTEPFSQAFRSDFYRTIEQYYPSTSARAKGIDMIIERLHRARFEENATWPRLFAIVVREIYRWLPP